MKTVTKTRLALLVVIMVLFFFVVRHVWGPLRVGIYYAYSASLYGCVRLGGMLYAPIDSWLQERTTVQKLMDEVKRLTQEKDRLHAEMVVMQGLSSYKADTQDLERFLQRYQLHKGVCAQIISRTLTSYAQNCYLNAGSCHGICQDMIMITNHGIIGRIDTVYPWFCKGTFITDASSNISCYTAQTHIKGVCEGANKEYCSFHVINGVDLPDDHELVMSSGHGFIFPQGFCVGEVIESTKTDNAFRSVVKPCVDLKTIDYCVIIARADIESEA